MALLDWQQSLFGADEPSPDAAFPSLRYRLFAGDLFVMGGTCQHTWEHCVPKARRAGPRMSVTFRHSLPRAAA